MTTMSLQELKDNLMKQMLADGVEFRKCANCGDVYPLGSPTDVEGEFWTDETVCGERCFDAFAHYLNNPYGYDY